MKTSWHRICPVAHATSNALNSKGTASSNLSSDPVGSLREAMSSRFKPGAHCFFG